MGLNPHTFAGTTYALVNPLQIKKSESFDCDERQRALRVGEAKPNICSIVTLASMLSCNKELCEAEGYSK